MNTVLTLFWGLTFWICLSDAAMESDVNRLLNDLQRNYSRSVRPPRNQSEYLTVGVTFSLIGLKSFDERESKFSIIGTVIIGWNDERITWHPDSYNGVSSILVENNVFWTPSIFLTNSLEELEKVPKDSYWPVRYYPNGLAFLYPDQSFAAACQAQVENFPWDSQNCGLIFSLIGYEASEIILIPYEDEDDSYILPLTNFIGDDLWNVESRVIEKIENNIRVGYKLKRKPLSSIINVIIPILLLSFLNIFVFLIPAESGERISFSLTVLLAIVVFLTLVSESMPKSATSIAILSYFLVSVLALSILITIGTILNMKIYFRGEKKSVPNCLKSFSRCILCKRYTRPQSDMYRHKHGSEKNDKSVLHNNPDPRRSNDNTSPKSYRQQIHCSRDPSKRYQNDTELEQQRSRSNLPSKQFTEVRSQSSIEDYVDGTNDELDQQVTWRTVSSAFDVVFFTISSVVLVALTVIFVVLARHNKTSSDIPSI